MRVLAIATSGDPCSIAILDEKGLLVERTFRHRMQLSERMMGDVREILADAGITLADLDALVVDVGPGSFTGVRIGVTAAKTWADLLGKPVVGVSSLQAVAHGWVGAHAGIVVPMIRARPGAAYTAEFDGSSGAEVRSPAMRTEAEMVEQAAGWSGMRAIVCGDGWAPFEAALKRTAGDHDVDMAFIPPRTVHATVFAEAGWKRLAAGDADDPIELAPMYIAPPPVGQKRRTTDDR